MKADHKNHSGSDFGDCLLSKHLDFFNYELYARIQMHFTDQLSVKPRWKSAPLAFPPTADVEAAGIEAFHMQLFSGLSVKCQKLKSMCLKCISYIFQKIDILNNRLN